MLYSIHTIRKYCKCSVDLLHDTYILMYSWNLFVLDFVRRFFVSCAYVDEIGVRLAENQPQKQVQERLRKYILHSRRFSMFSKNTSTTYKYFFMFVFFSLFLWQSFTIKPEASEIIADPLISMTVGDTKNLYFFHGSFVSLKACLL